MTEEQGEWLECVVDNDYEIYSEYPFPIRRKGSNKVISEWIHKTGYILCKLNKKPYMKHRIIALQFIPNDDPENKPFIDHRNRNRADNRIENLRWVNQSENSKNKSKYGQRQYVFLDELSDTAEPLEHYNNHEFDDLWIDYGNQKLYLWNGIKYRELLEHHSEYSTYFLAYDRNDGSQCKLCHSKLFD